MARLTDALSCVTRIPLDPLVNIMSTTAGALTVAGTAMAVRRAPGSAPGHLRAPHHLRGSGPVVVVGGFCSPPLLLAPLAGWLEDLGYAVTTHTVGAGMGCAARSVDALAETVRAAAERAGEPVTLVAHSRGGQFARVVASDPAVPVRRVVTLGTPLDLTGVSPTLMVQAAVVAAAGSAGFPGLATLACLYGRCCAEFRRRLRAPLELPLTVIYSRRDRAVRWRSCVDPGAHTVEVDGSHLSLLVDPAVLQVVAEQLVRPPSTAAAA